MTARTRYVMPALCLFMLATGSPVNPKPAAGVPDRESVTTSTLLSPRRCFSIEWSVNGTFQPILRFRDTVHSAISMDDDSGAWPPLFYISPDDRWILRVQKTGSGENTGILYRLDDQKRLWRMEQRLDDLAFAHLHKTRGIRKSDLYHTGIEFLSWNAGAGLLRFRLSGSWVGKSGDGIREQLAYSLENGRILPAEGR